MAPGPTSKPVPPASVRVLRPPDCPGLELELAANLPPTDIPRLAASGLEFLAVWRGGASLRYRGQRYQYGDARRLFVMHNLEDALTGSTQGPTSYRSLRVQGQTAQNLAAALGEAQLPSIRSPFAPDPLSKRLFGLTVRAIGGFLAPHTPLERELRLLRLFAAVFDSGTGSHDAARPREPRAVGEIQAYIHAHPESALSSSDLSRLTGLNAVYAAQVFRRHVGVTPSTYQRSVRVERAKALLVRGETAAQAAQALGFADQSHFIRVFRRYAYVTPGQFRRDNLVLR